MVLHANAVFSLRQRSVWSRSCVLGRRSRLPLFSSAARADGLEVGRTRAKFVRPSSSHWPYWPFAPDPQFTHWTGSCRKERHSCGLSREGQLATTKR